MKSVRVADLKANLSAHLKAVESGESITVLRRDQPVARLVPAKPEPRLRLRPAAEPGRIQDVPLPDPVVLEGDVVDLLLEDRERQRR